MRVRSGTADEFNLENPKRSEKIDVKTATNENNRLSGTVDMRPPASYPHNLRRA